MSNVLRELITLLALEKIEENVFRGQSQDLGCGTVFGGKVLGQALSAAVQTVPAARHVHSLHAYFLRPGDVKRPILYNVDRIRDGGSFTTRRVVAIQGGQAIFNLAASFQTVEEGFAHQDATPETPSPESLEVEGRHRERPFDIRIVDGAEDAADATPRPPYRRVWLKAAAPLADDPALHRYLLAYASDYALVTTALLPHGVTWETPGMQVASLDHVMWFHRP